MSTIIDQDGEEMAHLRKLRLNTFSDRLKSLYSE